MILANAYLPGALLALSAMLIYAISALGSNRSGKGLSRTALVLAWCLHGVLLVLGLGVNEPRFGFGPALSVTAWLVLPVYAVENRLMPHAQARWALAFLGIAAVLVAWAFPGKPLSLGVSPWFALHLAMGISSYCLFAMAVVHAWLLNRTEQQIRRALDPHSGIPLLTLERLTFRLIGIGFVLLSVTLLAGWLFGETLYGPGYASKSSWDHKTVFSVLSWVTFAALLFGRAYFGWRGRKATRVLYLGATFLLLAYAGSRFVIEVLLRRAV